MVSPVVSPRAYGNVISVCTHRGFVLQGIRQLQLSPKQGIVLSMTTSQVLDRKHSSVVYLGLPVVLKHYAVRLWRCEPTLL